MKRLHHFCVASVLTFALAISAFAGDINCGVTSAPPPQQSAVTDDIHTGGTATSETSSAETVYIDPVTGIALDILQSLLSLF
jgi:hypothetical protein